MPTQIAKLAGTISKRLADFARSIPDGEGWTIAEAKEKLKASQSQIKQHVSHHGIKREGRWYIVNPKTRAKYAD